MRISGGTLVAIIAVLMFGFSRPPAAPASLDQALPEPACPLRIEGTAARLENVEGGAAVTFRTTGDLLALQRQVLSLARLNNDRIRDMMGRRSSQDVIQSFVTAQKTQSGARLLFYPYDPAQLKLLKQGLLFEIEQLSFGWCSPIFGRLCTPCRSEK